MNYNSRQVYNNLEHNNRKLQLQDLVILKHRFNINPNWLIFGEGNIYYEENPYLINLILDFRQYGGETDIVKREIIKKILEKFYKQEKFLFLFKKKSHKFGNRPYYILIKILKSSSFNGAMNGAKNFLRNTIEEFHDKSPYLKDVKKALYSLLINISNKDCYYLLQNPIIAIEEMKSKEKILNIDIKIEDFLYGNDLVKIAD